MKWGHREMNEKKTFFGLSRNVFFTGLVSLLMDVSSEMIYPLVPLFLANVLGVNKSLIGAIEGLAESTASLLKVFSGWFSDRLGRRKGLMALGYAVSTLSRPLMASASAWQQVLSARIVDRIGKGVRTAPRDAIIAESSVQAQLARAFSFHRSMDTMGAVIGPALALFLLSLFDSDYGKIFWLSIVPAIAAVLVIFAFIREKGTGKSDASKGPRLAWSLFDWRVRFFIAIATLFALGNSSDVFLILKAERTGIPTATIPAVYLMFNLIYSLSAIPAGIAADRFGRKRIILLGFVLFAAVYVGFGMAGDAATIWALFAAYGVFMGLTEGVQKAFLASIIPSGFRATAFGVYSTTVGLAMFPASLIGGWLWDHFSPSATFYFGSATAALSALLFLVFMAVSRRRQPAVNG
jgi:MFS family permease